MTASLPSYQPLPIKRTPTAVRIDLALEGAASLRVLSQKAKLSAACLRLIAPIIPASMRHCILAGSLEDGQWCLLVSDNAAAAKLRQLSPTVLAHLEAHGQPVNKLRIKIQSAAS